MKKQIFSAVASLAVVAAMSVSAFAVNAGSTNGLANGTVGEDGKVTLDNSVTIEGLVAGSEVEVDVERADDADTQAVLDAVENTDIDVVSVNTVIEITAEQPEDVATVFLAYDGVSNAVLHIDGDEVEEIDLTVSDDKAIACFETDHFSTFYLVTLADETGDDQNPVGDKIPDTGVVLAVVPAIAAAAAIVVSKKRK